MTTALSIGKNLYATNTTQEAEIGTFSLAGGAQTEVLLGLYEREMPQPNVRVKVIDQQASHLVASLQRVDEKDEYRLVGHFKNTGLQPCRVSVVEIL